MVDPSSLLPPWRDPGSVDPQIPTRSLVSEHGWTILMTRLLSDGRRAGLSRRPRVASLDSRTFSNFHFRGSTDYSKWFNCYEAVHYYVSRDPMSRGIYVKNVVQKGRRANANESWPFWLTKYVNSPNSQLQNIVCLKEFVQLSKISAYPAQYGLKCCGFFVIFDKSRRPNVFIVFVL